MNLLKGLAAGAAAYAAYRGVEFVMDELFGPEPGSDGEDTLEKIEKDAVMVVGSRMDSIPNVQQRDAIVRGVNIAASIVATTAAAEIRAALFNDRDDGELPDLTETILGAAITFVLLDELLLPAMGLARRPSSWGGHARKFASHLASRTTHGMMRKALAA